METFSKTAMGSALFLIWMAGFPPLMPAQDAAAQDPFAGVIEATKADMFALDRCDGWQPWLGPRMFEPCDEPNRMLVRTASNAYFPLTMSVIALPERDEEIAKAVDQVWDYYLPKCTSIPRQITCTQS